MENYSDAQLIDAYFKGDQKALEALISHYLKPVYNFAFRYINNPADAEDVAQETFVKVWRSLKKFDQKRNFKTWLYSIAKNTAIDILRRKKSLPLSALEDEEGNNPLADMLADPLPLPDELLARQDLKRVLSEALVKLPSKQRLVLIMYYNEQLNFREIAESLEEPIDTVKSRHRRALVSLRGLLEPAKFSF